MGRLCFHPVRELKEIYDLTVMVETGTEHGYGVNDALRAGFDTVLSCEIIKEKYEHSKERFKDDNRVSLYFGDSKTCLELMLEKVKDRKSILFWLDAHLPMENGKRQCKEDLELNIVFPIVEELIQILTKRKGDQDVIIIDDAILFCKDYREKKFKNFDLKRFSNKSKTIDIDKGIKTYFKDHFIFLNEAERGSMILVPKHKQMKEIHFLMAHKLIENNNWVQI